jgi:hypothetical protein
VSTRAAGPRAPPGRHRALLLGLMGPPAHFCHTECQ